MGDISFHFNKRDFQCKCGECDRQFKMSLTLIGYLEYLRNHYNRRIEILKGFQCEHAIAKEGLIKKNWYNKGKAILIQVDGIPPQDVFLLLEQQPHITALGFDVDKNAIYFDLRDRESYKFVREHGVEHELTDVIREKYHLIAKAKEPTPTHVQ